MMTSQQQQSISKDKEEDDVPLPGFRFHPTDEELVGFYLHRKVEKKPIRIELIKQIDIYKHDPWDLPKHGSVGENEGYFFCKRGRKYRNSIRPNRVTGSGFWKATGIDKPVYSNASSHGGQDRDCIGLKKTLVYYRGSAGKGTKTDWMMHEFRLPPTNVADHNNNTTNIANAKTTTTLQEAEVWTLCRIFKRNVSYRKYTPDWRELASKRQQNDIKSFSMESNSSNQESYINFGSAMTQQYDQKPIITNPIKEKTTQFHVDHQLIMNPMTHQLPSMAASPSTFSNILQDGNDAFAYGNSWDDLRSVVEFAFHDPSLL